jgi:hypothetical protein
MILGTEVKRRYRECGIIRAAVQAGLSPSTDSRRAEEVVP